LGGGGEWWIVEVPQIQTLLPSVNNHTRIRNTAVKLM